MSHRGQDTKTHCTVSYAFAITSVFLPALLGFLQFSLDDGELYGQKLFLALLLLVAAKKKQGRQTFK